MGIIDGASSYLRGRSWPVFESLLIGATTSHKVEERGGLIPSGKGDKGPLDSGNVTGVALDARLIPLWWPSNYKNILPCRPGLVHALIELLSDTPGSTHPPPRPGTVAPLEEFI